MSKNIMIGIQQAYVFTKKIVKTFLNDFLGQKKISIN